MIGSRAVAQVRAQERARAARSGPGASRSSSAGDDRVDGQHARRRSGTAPSGRGVGELDRGERADRGAAHAGPKMPIASPRRSGGNQALTNGTPTANAVPPMPRKKPPTSSSGVGVGDEADEQDRQDRQDGDDREHHPAAEPVGQRARPGSGRASRRSPAPRPGAPAGTPVRPSCVAEGGAERADQRPGPEVDHEAERRDDEHPHCDASVGLLSHETPRAWSGVVARTWRASEVSTRARRRTRDLRPWSDLAGQRRADHDARPRPEVQPVAVLDLLALAGGDRRASAAGRPRG